MHPKSLRPVTGRIALILLILILCLKQGSAQFCNVALEFTTQEAIDQFPINYPDCDSVYSVLVRGAAIQNLNGLLGLRYVDYSLIIEKTSITSLQGLDSLRNPSDNFQLAQNNSLISLHGLEKVTGFNNATFRENLNLPNLSGLENLVSAYSLKIWFNDALIDLSPLPSFKYVWYLSIVDNRGLVSLNGLNNLQQVVEELVINTHPLLTSIDGLENISNLKNVEIKTNPKLSDIDAFRYLDHIKGNLVINDNNTLSDIDGLNAVSRVDGNITITQNDLLDQCDILFFCNRLHDPSKVNIANNATGCKSLDEVLITCSDQYSLAKGYVYVDYNCNNIQDANDSPVANSMILNFGYPVTNTGSDGTFMAFLSNNDTLIIHPTNQTAVSYTPPSYEIITDGNLHLFDSLVFALCADSLYHDLSVQLIPQTLTRRGSTAKYTICLKNAGLYQEDPAVELSFDNHPFIEIVNPSGGVVNGNTISWQFNDFLVQAKYCFEVEILIHAGAALDSFIVPSLSIAGADTIMETSLANNVVTFSQRITGSYDPNDKVVSLDQIAPSPEETLLAYTIRFQNTGNSYAEFVEVLDTLEAGLNVKSFEMVEASHPYLLSFPDTNVVKWRFDNIFLPDSTTNEEASHGFIHFLIHARGSLPPNSTIENDASIYFDFNEPVVTLPAITLVKLSTGIQNNILTKDKLRLYPNPNQGLLYVDLELQDASSASMDIISMDGNLLLSTPTGFLPAGQHTFQISVNTLPNGIYLLKCRTEKGVVSKKFVRVH